eukprot:jgi/Botrbrau1/13281/Bobra.27_2s0004.1
MLTPNKALPIIGLKKPEILTDAEQRAQKRQIELIEEDIRKVCNPNILAPFSSVEDAVTRLLPYHVFYEADPVFSEKEEPPADAAQALQSSPSVWSDYITKKAQEAAHKTHDLHKRISKLRAHMADPTRERPEEHYLLARLQAEEDKAFLVKAQAAVKAKIEAENAEIEAQRARALAALQSQQKPEEATTPQPVPDVLPPLQGGQDAASLQQAAAVELASSKDAQAEEEEEDPGGWTTVEDPGGWSTVEEPGGWSTVQEPGGWTTVGMLPPVEGPPPQPDAPQSTAPG